MILVTMTESLGGELFQIRIAGLSVDGDEARYSVQVATDRGNAIGLHQRTVTFDYTKYNPLMLLKLALEQLDEESFEAEDGEPCPPDLAWGFERALREIQGRASGLHHHGPAFRSGQSEQPGGDSGGEGVRPEDRQ